MNISIHAKYMSLALQLAEKGRLSVSPNPMVGCVIVKNNRVIGEGFHQYAGGPHAEIYALQQAGNEAKDAIVYTTLEPCCHQGRTPPCTNALIKSGVKEVYISCLDPNPLVKGGGVKSLQSVGIYVHVGLLEKESIILNEIFFHYISYKRPFVIAKWAMSLDGKTTVNELDDKNISGENSRQITHEIRQQVDAILVGANTVLNDNPQLTARNKLNTKQPLRIILAGKKYFPENLNIFNISVSKTIIVATKRTLSYVSHIKSPHIEKLIIPENNQQRIHLPSLLNELGKKEISSLLVEGGMTTHINFFEENLINKIYVFLSPTLISSFPKKKSIEIKHAHQAGKDFYFIANLKEYSHV